MTEAFEHNPQLSNLMCAFQKEISAGLDSYRAIVGLLTQQTALSLPVLTASLSYVNAMFTPVLSYGQMVSLQRDIFGRHGYERLDRDGKESFDWPEMQ